jgi:phage protein U
MITGSIGDIIFETSSSRALLFGEYSDTMAARIGTHDVAGIAPVLEFIGAGTREIELHITLMRSLGVDVEDEISKAQKYCMDGEILILRIGGRVIGGLGAKWMIESVDALRKQFAVDGSTISADLTLGLKLARTAKSPAEVPMTIRKKNVKSLPSGEIII